MQAHQFLDQCQADAGAFVGAARRALDAVEALEHARQFVLGNAGAGVLHRQARHAGMFAQRHRHAAVQRELEGVRQQVEDDLFPHVAVDEDRLGQRLQIDRVLQAALGHGRLEHAGQVDRQAREIDRDVAGLHAAGFDTRKVEQRIDQLEQAQRVAVRELDALALDRIHRLGRIGQRIVERAQDQRQRRTKFMRDVREERGLGAVDLGQFFGAALFLLVGDDVAHRSIDGRAEQGVEIAVLGVERAAHADPGHDKAEQLLLAGQGQWQHQRRARRVLVRPASDLPEARGHVVDLFDRMRAVTAGKWPDAVVEGGCQRRQWVARCQAGAAAQRQRAGLGIDLVEQHERHVGRHVRAVACQLRTDVTDRAHACQAGGQVTQTLAAARAEHLDRGFGNWVEDPADRARLVADRRERERHIGFFEIATAVEEHLLVADVRTRALVRQFEGLAHDRQGRGPDHLERCAHGCRMQVAADRAIGVVVDLDIVRAPADQDRERRRQAQADRCAQALRPAGQRSERRRRPVHAADQFAHFTPTGEPVHVVVHEQGNGLGCGHGAGPYGGK